ncbi:MAG: hypothetical protein ACK4V8_07560 [Moraxella osloensis]
MTMIRLPHDNNSQFNLALLLRFMIASGRSFLVQGQQQVSLSEHTKPQSLDYFLRTEIAAAKNTAQATTDVIEQLCATGLFELKTDLQCPDSGRACQGIELVGS